MPVPEEQLADAIRRVEAFCRSHSPPELSHELRIEYSRRGGDIKIVERRAPWRPGIGPEWSASPVALLRYQDGSGAWALRSPDSRGRWHPYEIEPNANLDVLLAEVDADPTGIFWG